MSYFELNEESQAVVYDAIYEGIYQFEDNIIGEEKIAKLFELIPEDIRELASVVKWNDAEVGDKICSFFEDNYEKLKSRI